MDKNNTSSINAREDSLVMLTIMFIIYFFFFLYLVFTCYMHRHFKWTRDYNRLVEAYEDYVSEVSIPGSDVVTAQNVKPRILVNENIEVIQENHETQHDDDDLCMLLPNQETTETEDVPCILSPNQDSAEDAQCTLSSNNNISVTSENNADEPNSNISNSYHTNCTEEEKSYTNSAIR
ncbi:hypothetical protein K6025_05160 [Ehrlichia sp. JZT12]